MWPSRSASTTSRVSPAMRLPSSTAGICVALADKLETLAGLFGIGEKPTGERDPYALRRHALGVLRMLKEQAACRSISARWSTKALAAFPAGVLKDSNARSALIAFFSDRLAGLLRDEGYGAQEIDAVLARRFMRIDQVPKRLEAVRAFMELPEATSLAAANKRIGNILKKSDDVPAGFRPRAAARARRAGARRRVCRPAPAAEAFFAKGDYTAMLRSLAPLKLPVDRFFDDVMVNVDDDRLRANRLGLLRGAACDDEPRCRYLEADCRLNW